MSERLLNEIDTGQKSVINVLDSVMYSAKAWRDITVVITIQNCFQTYGIKDTENNLVEISCTNKDSELKNEWKSLRGEDTQVSILYKIMFPLTTMMRPLVH